MPEAPLELGISDAALKRTVERPNAADCLMVLIDIADSDTAVGESRDQLMKVFNNPVFLAALKAQEDLEPFIKKAISEIEARGEGADGVNAWMAENLMLKAANKESLDKKVEEIKRVILRLKEIIVESLRVRILAIVAATQAPGPEPKPELAPAGPAARPARSEPDDDGKQTGIFERPRAAFEPAPAPAAPREAADETAIMEAFSEFLRFLEKEVLQEPDPQEFGKKAVGKGSQKKNKGRDLARVAKRAESYFAANGNMTQAMVDKALKDKLIGMAVESITAKINERGMYEAKIQKAEVAQAIANAWHEPPAAADIAVIPSAVEESATDTPAPAHAPRRRIQTRPGIPIVSPPASAATAPQLDDAAVAAAAKEAERLAGLPAPVRAYLEKKERLLFSAEPDCLQDLLVKSEKEKARDLLDDLAAKGTALGLKVDPLISLYRAELYVHLGLDLPGVVAIYTQALENPDCDEETMNVVLDDLETIGKNKADIANILVFIAAALDSSHPYKFRLYLAAAKVMDNDYSIWSQAGAIAEDQGNLVQAEICYGNAWGFANTQKGKDHADTVAARAAHKRVKAQLDAQTAES